MAIFNKNYRHDKFIPKHPEKCLNTNGAMGKTTVPEYRSSWEAKFMAFCDERNSVLEWGSEVLKIPYVAEEDGKQHQYITDFYFVCQDKYGDIKKYIIEVKPKSQVANLDEHCNVIYPDPPKHKTQQSIANWQERCAVIRKNNDKWTAARKWCRDNGFIFKILTEEEIGINY